MMSTARKKSLIADDSGTMRCFWCMSDPQYVQYHDTEWGFPVLDDRRLFEKICLEGFQSGLSWLTILRKRQSFRESFAFFDFEQIASFTKRDVAKLLQNAGIVRHRGKIESVINNARRAIALAEEHGSLAKHLWSFAPSRTPAGQTIRWSQLAKQTTSPQSVALSKDLKRRGWSYVGPTTMHAFMQAVGMRNDHLTGCDARERADRARELLPIDLNVKAGR